MRKVTLLALVWATTAWATPPSLKTGPVKSGDWPTLARRLTGESTEVTIDAMKRLRATPDLEEKLRRGLDTEERFAAYDVISTLDLKKLLPDLIRVSLADRTGLAYNAINALTPEKDGRERESTLQLYRVRLSDSATPFAGKVILLHTLARARAYLPPRVLEPLLNDESPEVRSAALYYVRYFTVRLGIPDYLEFLAIPFSDASPWQLRLQALYIVQELPPGFRMRVTRRLRGQFEKCAHESRAGDETHALCSLFAHEGASS